MTSPNDSPAGPVNPTAPPAAAEPPLTPVPEPVPPVPVSEETAPPAPPPALPAVPGDAAADASSGEIIPLPPPPDVLTKNPDRLRPVLGWLDSTLAAIVLVLAFFLGSFVARNSDLWQHLATGRFLAGGGALSDDPFRYTTSGRSWVNHSWFYDLAVYTLARVGGGPEAPLAGVLLVGAKAGLIVVLAAIMLAVRKAGQSVWIPAGCVAVALVAMGPRLYLQSTVLSFLFLAITLCLLVGPGLRDESPGDPPAGRRTGRRLLIPLFALWANVDVWFLLGPLTVGLFLVGELLGSVAGPRAAGATVVRRAAELRWLAVIAVVGLAACVLNPYHVRVFTVPPPEVAVLGLPNDVPPDDVFRSLKYAPLPELIGWASGRQSPYVMSHFANDFSLQAFVGLVLVGFVSFLLNRGPGRWNRLPLWMFFLTLGGLSDRAVPFFAVVGGPIAALNFQELAAEVGWSPLATDAGRAWALGGRGLSVIAGLGLLAVGWVGGLTSRPSDPRTHRRVDWRIEVDPGLKQTALNLGRLREDGVLSEQSHGFNGTRDQASYFAWFCPAEKCFFDARFSDAPGLAVRYVELRRSLPGADPAAKDRRSDWVGPFREHGIDHIILTARTRTDDEGSRVLETVWNDPAAWTLLSLEGGTAVFRWNDPERVGEGTKPAGAGSGQGGIDLTAVAFGKTSPIPSPAPPGQVSAGWERWLSEPPPRSEEVDRSWVLLRHAEGLLQSRSGRYGNAMLGSFWLSWLTLQSPETDPRVTGTVMAFRNGVGAGLLQHLYTERRDFSEPAVPLLAEQAARRAVAASPDDPEGWFVLGLVCQQFPPPGRPGPLTPIRTLRSVQMLAALRRALALQPDDPQTNHLLALAYLQVPSLPFPISRPPVPDRPLFRELWLKHYKESLRLTRQLQVGNPKALKELDDRVNDPAFREKEKKLKNDLDDFALRSAGKRLGEKVAVALDLGLGATALDLLEHAPAAELQSAPILYNLQLYMLLGTGRVDDLRQAFADDPAGSAPRRAFGKQFPDRWFGGLVDAAGGDLAPADELFADHLARLDRESALARGFLVGTQLFPLALGTTRLEQSLREGLLNMPARQAFSTVGELSEQAADLETIRGLLALQSGEPVRAADRFRAVLTAARFRAALTQDRVWAGTEGTALAERFLREIERQTNPPAR